MQKLKKLLSVLLCAVMTLAMAPCSVMAEDSQAYNEVQTDNGLLYYVYNDHAEIVGYSGSSPELDIPAEVEGKPVTSISGRGIFSECATLERVTVPGSIKTIGQSAFYACENLTEVKLNEGLQEICYGAFNGCKSLAKINIPNSVIKIGGGADYYSGDVLTGTAYYNNPANWENGGLYIDGCLIELRQGDAPFPCEILEGTRLIADGVFNNFRELPAVYIPDSVTSCGDIFSGWDYLPSITIGRALECLPAGAFDGTEVWSLCIMKSAARIPDGVFGDVYIDYIDYAGSKEDWAGLEIGTNNDCIPSESIFFDQSSVAPPKPVYTSPDGVAFRLYEDGADVVGYIGKGRSVVIPAEVNGLPVIYMNDCFSGTDIESVTLPGSIEEIPYEAFYDCKKLTNVTLGNGIRVIEDNAFDGCDSLQSITFPETLEEIGMEAFRSAGLTSITIPESVKLIEDNAFEDCPMYCALIKKGVKEIGSYFSYRLKKLYYAGSQEDFDAISLSYGDDYYDVFGDAELTVGEELAEAKLYNEGGLFYLVYGDRAEPAYAAREFDGYVREAVDGKPVTVVDAGAFNECDVDLYIPDSVTRIKGRLMYGQIVALHLGKGLKEIDAGVFDVDGEDGGSCEVYELYYAGTENEWNSTVKIGENNDALNAAERYFKTPLEAPPVILSANMRFELCGDHAALIHAGELNDASIPSDINGLPVTELRRGWAADGYYNTVTLPESISVIKTGNPNERYRASIGKLYIGSGVKEIEDLAFEYTEVDEIYYAGSRKEWYSLIEYTDLGKGVDYADVFFDVEFESPKLISDDRFSFLVYSDHAVLLRYNADEDTLEIPAEAGSVPVTEIADDAAEFKGFSTLVLPDSVIKIGSGAFREAYRLNTLVVPDSVEEIGDAAFYNTQKLQNVYLGNGIKHIGDAAFFSEIYVAPDPDSSVVVQSYSSSDREDGFGLIENLYFSGSKEQWEEFLINDWWYENDRLMTAKNIYFNANFSSAAEIAGVAVRNGKVIIAIDRRNLPDDATLTAVAYNGEALIEAADVLYDRVELNGEGVTHVKLFCWESLESLRPLCAAKEVEVSQ